MRCSELRDARKPEAGLQRVPGKAESRGLVESSQEAGVPAVVCSASGDMSMGDSG